jgi:Uma2 family endonuclease
MKPMSPSSLMTADKLLRLPSGTWRHELVDGVLRRMTPAGHVHGRVAETGFLLRQSPDTVRAPDAAFVSRQRLASMALLPEGYFPGSPDLAVEVLSPSDSRREVDEKVADWLASGCRAVLVLDPADRLARLHRPGSAIEHFSDSDRVTVPELLPGWAIDLKALFR